MRVLRPVVIIPLVPPASVVSALVVPALVVSALRVSALVIPALAISALIVELLTSEDESGDMLLTFGFRLKTG